MMRMLGLFLAVIVALPLSAQQARQMTRSTTAFGDSSLVVTSDTLTSKTTFVTKAVSLAQMRKSLSKFAFDSVLVTGNVRTAGVFASTTVSGPTVSNTSGTTGKLYNLLANSAGQSLWGIESSVGGELLVGSTAYATVFGNTANRVAQIGVNGVINATFNTNGSTTLNGLTVTTLAGTGAVSGFTTLGLTGTINSTLTGSVLHGVATTGSQYMDLNNTGGQALIGIETSVGGTIVTGTAAYSTIFGTNQARSLHLYTNNALALTINSAGAFDFLTHPVSGVTTLAATKPTFSDTARFSGKAVATALTAAAGTPNSVCIDASTKEITENAALTCTVSARRFKTDIASLSLTEAKRIVMALNPSTFTMRSGGRKSVGLIAEDVDAVDARLTFRDAKGVLNSVDYQALGPILVKLVQDQQRQLDSLKTALRVRKP